jgi:hypothetical protein
MDLNVPAGCGEHGEHSEGGDPGPPIPPQANNLPETP